MGLRATNKLEKERRLLDAGLAAFLRDGFARASIETIAADAQVARGTFYLYFKDKESLFLALVDRLFVPLLASVHLARDAFDACEDVASMLPVYAGLGLALSDLCREKRGELLLTFQEARAAGRGGEAVRARLAEVETAVARILDRSVARGVVRPHDTHLGALTIVGAVERLAWAWLSGDAALDLDSVPLAVTSLLNEGFLIRA